MNKLDKRFNAYNDQIADERLEGKVTSKLFVKHKLMTVKVGQCLIYERPDTKSRAVTEALFNEIVKVFIYTENKDNDWHWIQKINDNYVGYMPAKALSETVRPDYTHWVSNPQTILLEGGKSVKDPLITRLPFGVQVEVKKFDNKFAILPDNMAIPMQHLTPVGQYFEQPTSVARLFLSAPYLWGGRTVNGIDCSGLVSVCLNACGMYCPSDSDMQLHHPDWHEVTNAPAAGDLVFWPGHVAMVSSHDTIIHANAHHMQVVEENLQAAIHRLADSDIEVLATRRAR